MRLSATNAPAQRAASCSASASSSPSPSPQASIQCRRRRRPSIPLSRRPASSARAQPLVTGVVPLSSSTSTKGATRREIRAAAAPETEPSAPPRRLELVGALPADASLDERISSGEFTDSGSTKERASRPVRKFLAQDPFGPGERLRREGSLGVGGREGTCEIDDGFFLFERLAFFLFYSFGRERARKEEEIRRGRPGHTQGALFLFLLRPVGC